MQREWKLWLVFVGLIAVLPFVHEWIHTLTSASFGYPSWIVWGSLASMYSYDTLPPLWIRLVIRYSPELVFLPIAAILTWKFRNDWALMIVLPFLVWSIVGFLGHAGYL